MADDDWNTVSYARKPSAPKPKGPKPVDPHSTQAVNAAQRRGEPVDVKPKFAAGTNKQHRVDKNVAVLDRESEKLHHDTIGADVGRLIQQRRAQLQMTQKDLGVKISERQQLVAEYEQGSAIPSQQVLNKLERVLGIRLRGREKGQPLE